MGFWPLNTVVNDARPTLCSVSLPTVTKRGASPRSPVKFRMSCNAPHGEEGVRCCFTDRREPSGRGSGAAVSVHMGGRRTQRMVGSLSRGEFRRASDATRGTAHRPPGHADPRLSFIAWPSADSEKVSPGRNALRMRSEKSSRAPPGGRTRVRSLH